MAVTAGGLRPLDVGETVDAAIGIYKSHLSTLLTTVAVIIGPVAAVQAALRVWAMPDDPWSWQGGLTGFALFVVGVVSVGACLIAAAACNHAAAQAYFGGRPHWYDAIGHVTVRLHRLVPLVVVVGVGVAVGLFLLILPGIWLAVTWSMAVPAALCEGLEWRAALDRSRRLVMARWWSVFGTLAIGVVLGAVVWGIASAVLQIATFLPGAHTSIGEFVRYTASDSVGAIVATPFVAVLSLLLYVDLRLRAGDLDVDDMARHLDVQVEDGSGEAVMARLDHPTILRGHIDDLMRKTEEKTRALLAQLSRPSDRGEPPLPIDPDRPLAILVTDVDGSTELVERLGDIRARQLLRVHEDLVRGAVRAHGGREVRTTGDGLMACFATASRSIDCALMIQREQAVRNRANGGDVSVRVGINAGEPVVDDGDVFGVAVEVAADIVGVAGPGQVVVSDVVRQLAAGKGYQFTERGEAVLGDLSEPVRLFTLVA